MASVTYSSSSSIGNSCDCFIDNEYQLLLAARNGDIETVSKMLEDRNSNKITLDINSIGKNKCNRGWTALHLSAYFGHEEVVRCLIENGADVNVMNDVGDSPLHRAAYTGRQNIVLLLLQHGADVNVINSEGCSASAVAKTEEIKSFIEAAVKTEQMKKDEKFLKAARDGDHEMLSQMLKATPVVNVNCTDAFGNTALHLAALRGRKAVVILLLQAGIDATLRNARNQLAIDLTADTQMKLLLDVKSNRLLNKQIHRHEGTLLKKVRLLGWKPIWVVLERGVLSVFASRADATTGCNRKWFKYLDGAKVQTRLDTPHLLVVTFADCKSVMFSVGTQPNSLIMRQQWENALLEHISYNIRLGGIVIDDDKDDDEVLPLGSLQDTLRTAQAHQQVLEKQVGAALTQFSQMSENGLSGPQSSYPQLCHTFTEIVDSSRNMSSALSQCLTVFIQQDQVRRVQLEQEMEKSRILEESLRVLAQEHLCLERSINVIKSPNVSAASHQQSAAIAASPSVFSNSEADEFFDCASNDSLSDTESPTCIANGNDVSTSVTSFNESLEHDRNHDNGDVVDLTVKDLGLSVWGSRCRLPVPMFSRASFSVWSILKQCIGRELSKITMPVILNEPLSFLQRMVEYMEYAELLKLAVNCDDPVARHEYVTAFAVSASASNWDRLGKPFNPLLGETYQLDRESLGYRVMCEQVSHHPPVSAFHVESPDYIYHGAIQPKLKFWGKSVEVTPKGIVTLYLKRFNETYSWQNINCCVHNIIVGKIWIEHYGVMEVTNHKTQCKAVVNFKPSGWFGSDLHKLEGYILDRNKAKLRALYGKWTESFYSCDQRVWDEFLSNNSAGAGSTSSGELSSTSMLLPATDDASTTASNVFADERHSTPVTRVHSAPVIRTLSASEERDATDCIVRRSLFQDDRSVYSLELKDQKLLWTASPKPEDTHQYYNFTLFAMMLNELDANLRTSLPPTDSRLRPDIRRMEEGDIDGAADEKNRLEEKQRATRKDRRGDSSWKPRWFIPGQNPHTGRDDWLFTGAYWNKDWSVCPDIF